MGNIDKKDPSGDVTGKSSPERRPDPAKRAPGKPAGRAAQKQDRPGPGTARERVSEITSHTDTGERGTTGPAAI
jgi:hypothetical protein